MNVCWPIKMIFSKLCSVFLGAQNASGLSRKQLGSYAEAPGCIMSPDFQQTYAATQQMWAARVITSYNPKLYGCGNHNFSGFLPIKKSDVKKMEEQLGVVLPDEYRNFLIGGLPGPYVKSGLKASLLCGSTGNGLLGPKSVYLTTFDECKDGDAYEKDQAKIYIENEEEDDDESVNETEKETNITRSLVIASGGCQYTYHLVLEGPMKGSVIFYDGEYYEVENASFIAWLEDWLKEKYDALVAEGK
jgi:hypothetical protein